MVSRKDRQHSDCDQHCGRHRSIECHSWKAGTIVLNLAQGTCRLVIGDANKRSYTIVTPTAAIGVRG
jgi:hypothetical protein